MISFKKFLLEYEWIRPTDREHHEVKYQLKNYKYSIPKHLYTKLKELSDKNIFSKEIDNAKKEIYDKEKIKKVDNTTASDGNSFEYLKKEKQKRVKTYFDNGTIETPIILRHKQSGHEHLLSGNTRATYGIKKDGNFTATVIEY